MDGGISFVVFAAANGNQIQVDDSIAEMNGKSIDLGIASADVEALSTAPHTLLSIH